MNFKEYFIRVFRSGNHSHFYLFSEEGILEDALCVLFCERNAACGVCKGCRSIAAQSNPDVFVLKPEQGAKIRDEQVEEAIAHTETFPVGAYRVVVIVNAENMTVRAQNHLLKSLEEAPKRVVYLMQSRYPESLLSTVVSRAIRIRGKKNRGHSSALTDVLLSGSAQERDACLKPYKEQRGALIEELTRAADEATAKWRVAVLGHAEEAAAIRRMVMRADEVIRNLEQNGNFDLNIDRLIFWEETW